MGLILGLNYIYSRNLWFSFVFISPGNSWKAPAFGYSGDESFQTFLQPELNGDVNITGGANGLEGSVFLTAVALLSLIACICFSRKNLIHDFDQLQVEYKILARQRMVGIEYYIFHR